MKRLAWLLIFVVGTALAQVRPVMLPATQEDLCGCCGADCACALPAECAPPPAQSSAMPLKLSPAATLRLEKRAVARAENTARFYSAFAPAALPAAGLRAPVEPVPTAREPLFTVHCSLLL